MKWADEFNDQYENGTTSSRWSAMIQDQFKGSEMETIVQEAKEKWFGLGQKSGSMRDRRHCSKFSEQMVTRNGKIRM